MVVYWRSGLHKSWILNPHLVFDVKDGMVRERSDVEVGVKILEGAEDVLAEAQVIPFDLLDRTITGDEAAVEGKTKAPQFCE